MPTPPPPATQPAPPPATTPAIEEGVEELMAMRKRYLEALESLKKDKEMDPSIKEKLCLEFQEELRKVDEKLSKLGVRM